MAAIIPAAPQRTRSSGPRRHRTAPVIRPATRLPRAQSASRNPAYPLLPSSSAKATVVTSAAPKSVPSAVQTRASGTTVAHGIEGRGPAAPRLGCAGGSVRRWAANSSVPTTPVTSAVASPAVGWMVVASTVTRIGPSMNTVSSATASSAKAVCRSSGESSSVGPAGPDARAHGGQRGARQHRERVGEGDRPVGLHRPDQQAQGDAEAEDERGEHAALPEPVEQAALDDRDGAVGEQVGRRHRAGEAVGAGGRGDQQHDAQADHRDRQARDQAGGAEQGGARHAQDPAVRRQHGQRSVGPSRDRLRIIVPSLRWAHGS